MGTWHSFLALIICKGYQTLIVDGDLAILGGRAQLMSKLSEDLDLCCGSLGLFSITAGLISFDRLWCGPMPMVLVYIPFRINRE